MSGWSWLRSCRYRYLAREARGIGYHMVLELVVYWSARGMKIYIRYSGQNKPCTGIFEVIRSETPFVLDIVNSRIPHPQNAS